MRRLRWTFSIALLGGLLAGCAAPGGVACTPAETAQGCAVTTELFFGLERPGGSPVSAAEWDDFLAATVTPRFPAGLTVMDGAGQWRGSDGKISREPAKILVLVQPGGADDSGIAAVIAAYKKRFAQESVLRIDLKSNARF